MANRERKNELKIYLSDDEQYILEQKDGLLCIPHFFHQFLYLFYISGIDVSCGVHALCYLVQIAADFSECGIVFPKFGIVNVINKTIQNLAAQESGFAFHAGKGVPQVSFNLPCSTP